MEKRKSSFGAKFLLLALAFVLLQCGAEEDGGADYGAPTTPVAVTVTAANLNTNFDENPEAGATIGTVQASASSGTVRFSIVSQSDAGALTINATSGQISVGDASLFDYESRMLVTAVVSVSSGSVSEEVTVTVNLVDVSEVDISALTLWEGTSTTFTKENGGDPTLASSQDRISENVWLTRGNEGILFNAVSESVANNTSSPAGTEWAQGTFADLGMMEFTNFRAACPSDKPKNVVGIPMVLHLIQDDVYIQLTITSWAQGKLGGFTYQRSTP